MSANKNCMIHMAESRQTYRYLSLMRMFAVSINNEVLIALFIVAL